MYDILYYIVAIRPRISGEDAGDDFIEKMVFLSMDRYEINAWIYRTQPVSGEEYAIREYRIANYMDIFPSRKMYIMMFDFDYYQYIEYVGFDRKTTFGMYQSAKNICKIILEYDIEYYQMDIGEIPITTMDFIPFDKYSLKSEIYSSRALTSPAEFLFLYLDDGMIPFDGETSAELGERINLANFYRSLTQTNS